jgi:hypothetical protein
MRVMQGKRPPRPSPGNRCSLEPTDEAWDLISRCWAHKSDARPKMVEVCSALAGEPATPISTDTPRSASESISCALAIYNVPYDSFDIMIALDASNSLLEQPVPRRGGRRSSLVRWAELTARYPPDSLDDSDAESGCFSPWTMLFQAQALYACGYPSSHVGTVQAADEA